MVGRILALSTFALIASASCGRAADSSRQPDDDLEETPPPPAVTTSTVDGAVVHTTNLNGRDVVLPFGNWFDSCKVTKVDPDQSAECDRNGAFDRNTYWSKCGLCELHASCVNDHDASVESMISFDCPGTSHLVCNQNGELKEGPDGGTECP